ncbi:hypothetical protein BXZ70DRAFT_907892 [Cristinia sonorae]|uniref:TEA domain-containing protein n=1 Tax=Cristinia sonorae TaxID=1940300 RepID=A0A8K0ULN4_9AGAR|nr:hypothetical protein BXZ70DRAFT_907892 [Cristinia sonorae]
MSSDAFYASLKSLTPQRKHHKLLKDGSEVWSEDVENIFVQGLKEYWESPWATYSRGRSRWRNQFLVDHLKKHGIERTKKQVASHIQVLRNMWRGSPEFHLVAGGEELFQEDGLLASPKKAGTPSTPGSGSDVMDDQHTSASSTPSSAVSEFPAHFTSAMSAPQFMPTDNTMVPLNSTSLELPPSASPSTHALPYSFAPPSPPSVGNRLRTSPVKLEPLHMNPGLFNLPHSPQGNVSDNDLSPLFPSYAQAPQVRVLKFTIWAEGMQPLAVDIDRLNAIFTSSSRSPEATSVLLRVKMGISSMDDILSSPNLHGFHAAVTFSDMWTSEAKCITKGCVGSRFINRQVGDLIIEPTLSSPDMPHRAVTCVLPESSLSRCKWLPTEQDKITQQIAIDGSIVAAFVYHIERTAPGAPPSVEIVDFQKHKPSQSRMPSQQVMNTPLSAYPPAPSSSSTSYPNAGYPTPMDFGLDPMAQPHLNTGHMESYSFSSHITPSMYTTDPSPQLTATSSAGMLYSPLHPQ